MTALICLINLVAIVCLIRALMYESQQCKSKTDLLEEAWGLIANSYDGDWPTAPRDWHAAAVRWRDKYHKTLTTVTLPPQIV